MKIPVRPSSFAQDEIEHYLRHYEAESRLLAERLWTEIQTTAELISEHPAIGERVRRIGELVRRFPLRHFPFFLIYRERDGYIQIVALAHSNRKPTYWRSRLKSE